MKKNKSIIEMAGCKNCEFNTAQGSCIKFGFTSKNLEDNPYFHGKSWAGRITDHGHCPSWSDRGQAGQLRRLKERSQELEVVYFLIEGKRVAKTTRSFSKEFSRILTSKKLYHGPIRDKEMPVSKLALEYIPTEYINAYQKEVKNAS